MFLTLNDRTPDSSTSIQILDDANSPYTVDDLKSTSFSEAYVSGGVDPTFEVQVQDFGDFMNYVAIAGHNAYGKVTTVDFYTTNGSGSTFIFEKSYVLTSNATIFHVFETRRPKYKVVFNKINNSDQISLARVMGGDAWEMPRGGFERAGHKYLTTTPQLKQRTQMGGGIPTASLFEYSRLSGSLSMPDLETTEVADKWVEFQRQALMRGFLYMEDKDKGDEAVYCYNVKPKPVSAHSSTLNLQGISVSFNAWTGRNV